MSSTVSQRALHRRYHETLHFYEVEKVEDLPVDLAVELTVESLTGLAGYKKIGRPLAVDDAYDRGLAVILGAFAQQGRALTVGFVMRLIPHAPVVPHLPDALRLPPHQAGPHPRPDARDRRGAAAAVPEDVRRDVPARCRPDLVGNFDEAMCNNSGHAKVVGMTMSQVAGVETEIPHISVAPVIVANGTLRTSP